ncbi:uncharacterized protein LOC131047921 [Cryptomeria japonica]|uniref:uncharacterized protein LOC131047921 n=1 Tax=Cryptomeria japonica TaxID=3369 RepID=UPI0027DA81A9|nr:uncharacterized protein LOC131047921 [Cryptomeria japonica]
MDPGEQPMVLKWLSQVEEMLIARSAPVLQVSHARGDQYKYIGHTINFPQDISEIATTLPCKFQHLEIVIIRRTNLEGKQYDCYVNKFHVMVALNYKIQHDQYYSDVIIDAAVVDLLPQTSADISNFLYTLPNSFDLHPPSPTQEPLYNDDEVELQATSSFIPKLPCSTPELDAIKKILHLDKDDQNVAAWLEISFSPINEYNTEGLFSMAFPTLFPSGSALPLQPRTKHVHLHEYALHLIRYHDQRFGQHVRFRYYLYNLIMRHRSQQSASVFLRTNLEDSIQTTLQALCEQLQSTPSDQLPNQLMYFAASLRGTRAYCNRSHKDLTTMVHQLGAPTLFFTLSAIDTKWLELHKLFPANSSSEFQSTKKKFIQNIFHNPHATTLFLHFRFTIFREEIIDKVLKSKDHWYRYEWQHRGSAHIHGFLWLSNAPDMDNLDWSNYDVVQSAKSFFDRYVTTWNPCNQVSRDNRLHTTSLFHPCMADTNQILFANPLSDYEELVNVVQRHTKCSTHTCLKKEVEPSIVDIEPLGPSNIFQH